MAEERIQRKLAAILVADVAGYSRLMGADEAGTRTRFNDQLDDVVRPAIEEHRGRLVKTMGDGFLVEFGSVVDAVECAANFQNGVVVRQNSEPDDRKNALLSPAHTRNARRCFYDASVVDWNLRLNRQGLVLSEL